LNTAFFFFPLVQVAGRAGQACQVELLLVYGADPGAVDKSGRTASDYARQSGHGGLASRIDSSQFELSDRMSFFLTGKRPEHSAGIHFIVPEFADAADKGGGSDGEQKKLLLN
jgi:G protein-coupled receptor kinase interacting protein 2